MNEHDSQHAVFYYKQQLAKYPQDLETRRKLASCFRMRGDSKQCVAVLDSIPTDSLNHEDLRMFFYSYLNLGDNKNIGLYGWQISMKYPNDSEVFAALLSQAGNRVRPSLVIRTKARLHQHSHQQGTGLLPLLATEIRPSHPYVQEADSPRIRQLRVKSRHGIVLL